ncbi:MAG TPA: hypothetical protein DCZ94_17810 [Lentisphaeria bacterium]|nr:MAG: hypothetical protein A2X48_03640 [Lentisphaerae bacterium GWF2_49_21]HBC88802.1 hypothetical protein [Lentisphaeria bacterium]
MTRRERLMATLNGAPVDRPPVSFYELNGVDENPNDKDPFNIYSHPSWKPLIDLTMEKTDRIVRRHPQIKDSTPNPIDNLTKRETYYKDGSRYVETSIKAGKRTLKSLTRHDPDVNTTWTLEHLIKDIDDLKAYLDIPPEIFSGTVDVEDVIKTEKLLGDTGIVMLDTGDPLCSAASLFDMADYTVTALTEQELFHKLLQRFATYLHARTEAVAKAVPGRLWRIYGPEYASAPYLPPDLFNDYVVAYDKPMVYSIHKHGGFARIHSHGNLKNILDLIVETGAMGLDPIEPPGQGDVELEYVRKNYGKQLVLFGNLEISDIETMPTNLFEKKIDKALMEGTAGEGRGFVLMPSACPYGRVLSELTLRNYEKTIELVEAY